MQNTPPPKRGLVPRAAAWPLIAFAALGALFLATRPLGGEPQPSFFVIGSVAPGVQVGQIAPGTARAGTALALTDLDGVPVQLRDFADHPIWLIFWKTACDPCEAEAADVEAAFAAHRSHGLILVGVDAWDSAAVTRDYAEEHPFNYPIAIDSSLDFMDAYGLWGAPTHYFIGPDGIIRSRYFGPMSRELIDESLRTIDSTGAP